MQEQWKIFRYLKDDKHPYASKWEVSNLGRIKRDGEMLDMERRNFHLSEGKQKTAGGYIWKYKEDKWYEKDSH